METLFQQNKYTQELETLQINCGQCCGICCVALYYAKAEGFPCDKAPGKVCSYLQEDFKCSIHKQLFTKHLKGCMSYDCFGAGQFVTQELFNGSTWRTMQGKKQLMFGVFLKVEQLFQMRAYLLEAAQMVPAEPYLHTIDDLITVNKALAGKAVQELTKMDIEPYRDQVNECLKKVLYEVQQQIGQKVEKTKHHQLIGKQFKRADLSGRDFAVSLLMGADLEGCRLYGTNFLGADMRDTNIKNTDLSQSLFLTQGQINAARGNSRTKLPAWLKHPATWRDE